MALWPVRYRQPLLAILAIEEKTTNKNNHLFCKYFFTILIGNLQPSG